MDNISYVLDGNKMVITVLDTKADKGPSKSGKTVMVASTGGFVQVPEAGIAFALNVTRPNSKR